MSFRVNDEMKKRMLAGTMCSSPLLIQKSDAKTS